MKVVVVSKTDMNVLTYYDVSYIRYDGVNVTLTKNDTTSQSFVKEDVIIQIL